MTFIRPFCSIRPGRDEAAHVAALPYDVYSREEAKKEVEREPLSFLKIDRAETQLPDSVDPYDAGVYEKAKELLQKALSAGIFTEEKTPCYYLYELTREGQVQTGIAACSSVDDYINGVVKKHENTREDKELDRIRHVDALNAQTGPIFLAYRKSAELKALVGQAKQKAPVYDFTSPDGVRHRVFLIDEKEQIQAVTNAFAKIPCTYIADGHHRAASAVKVALKRRSRYPDYSGKEEFNYFLSVLFPEDELKILPYNRVVRDLNGLSEAELLRQIEEAFTVRKAKTFEEAVCPKQKGEIGLLLKSGWYELKLREGLRKEDPVGGLDVSVLQDLILKPILGIEDPRTDHRIAFIGGIRGSEELSRRVSTDMAAAFSLYPTSMRELLQVADAGLLMPPKSTWFEPKLRSGLLIHRI